MVLSAQLRAVDMTKAMKWQHILEPKNSNDFFLILDHLYEWYIGNIWFSGLCISRGKKGFSKKINLGDAKYYIYYLTRVLQFILI